MIQKNERRSYASDLSDSQWAVIEPLFPRTGNRSKWRNLPHDFPPYWGSVWIFLYASNLNGRSCPSGGSLSGSRSCGERGQMERYEYASVLKDVDRSLISDVFRHKEGVSFVKKYLADLVSCNDLKTTITIVNWRTQYIVEKQSRDQQIKETYELAFDDVTFENSTTTRTCSEKQIEIELKSDAATRLNMQGMTNQIEKKFADWNLTVMTESKYERAKKFTQ